MVQNESRRDLRAEPWDMPQFKKNVYGWSSRKLYRGKPGENSFTKMRQINFSKQVRSIMPNIPDILKVRPNKSIGLYYKCGEDSCWLGNKNFTMRKMVDCSGLWKELRWGNECNKQTFQEM